MSTDSMNPQALEFGLAKHDVEHEPIPAQAKVILKMLESLKHGALQVKAPDGRLHLFGEGSSVITMELKNWNLCSAALKSGDIGMAETFIDGHWTTNNLPGLIELMIRNRSEIESLIYGTWWGSLLYRIRHLFNRNSRSGSRKNIHAHYDIGNDFYRLWLDESMTYSSALFSSGHGGSLQAAQTAKYQRILDELQLRPHDNVLEVGCGWGGFAEIAAHDAQAHVTGLTLSTEQLQYARQRVRDAGVADRVDLQLRDYRDSHGQYDAIASIEMFEAVGEAYWPSYFECIKRNLKTHGRACIQTIVIDDALFARYRKGTDFIQQYIFPGGMLPSPTVFKTLAEQHGLRVVNEFAFGLDYARTLQEWRRVFNERLVDVRAQGFDERFVRTWEFYLSYCEAGFRTGSIDVMQFTLEKN